MEIIELIIEVFGSLGESVFSGGSDKVTNVFFFVIYFISLVIMLIGIIANIAILLTIGFFISLICFILFILTL